MTEPAPKPATPTLHAIQYLRAAAALAVVVYHTWRAPYPVL